MEPQPMIDVAVCLDSLTKRKLSGNFIMHISFSIIQVNKINVKQ